MKSIILSMLLMLLTASAALATLEVTSIGTFDSAGNPITRTLVEGDKVVADVKTDGLYVNMKYLINPWMSPASCQRLSYTTYRCTQVITQGKGTYEFRIQGQKYNSCQTEVTPLLGTYAVDVLPPVPSIALWVYQKNPTDWSIVRYGYQGIIYGKNGKMQFYAKVKPSTSYTLIYYGDTTHNDEWPYATCIVSATSSAKGWALSSLQPFNYAAMLDDSLNQKFWLVPTADLDCANSKFLAWNPTQIVFDTATI